MSPAKDNAICFLVHSAENNVVSYCYRVWAAGTSFYIKLRGIEISVKVSVHGPDPRPDLKPGFKFAIDNSAADKAHEISVWRFEPGAQMGWFPGVMVGDQAVHLARIRIPWSALQRGVPSGPVPPISSSIGLHGKLRPPTIFDAVDVDLYLSESGSPYWPDVEKVKRDNAGMGPLTNAAGQYLTAVCTHRSVWRDQHTAAHDALTSQFDGPLGRTLAVNLDESGFLWIRELIAPTSMLRQHSADELRAINPTLRRP
jgi:hypothetical protein